MANVLRRLIRESSLLAPDFSSFRRQESTFIFLNLAVLAGLLLMHTLFAAVLGSPPRLLLAALAAGFLVNVIELIWVQGKELLSAAGMTLLTWCNIALTMALAFTLASLSYRQDIQYFALLITPILQAAFRFSFAAAAAVVAASMALEFFWVWNYFRTHPPAQINEYMEAATISLIYAIVGILVWTLVNNLRSKADDLESSLAELRQTRERLLMEEKLAAVGRFSSAIAHEIRNPVAMISSAIATALNGGLSAGQRLEMFSIAAGEASRLEKLTNDFLAYARPGALVRHPGDLSEFIAYVADVCRSHAGEKDVAIETDAPDGLRADFDAGQVQQALLNLAMNAVEASSSGSTVFLRGTRHGSRIGVDIENSGGPIPPEVANRIFEPFFTTKPTGTGLGLAIAGSIARGHGGDLVLSRNERDSVRFSFTLPAYTENSDLS